jgi:radical SAM protein with 4Fe4S-binding SPASM domain
MIDIGFFQKVHDLKKRIINGEKLDKKYIFNCFEDARSKNDPVIYNIETTNACNMRCKMCPRTTMMTRSVVALKQEEFKSIIKQIRPFTNKEWRNWEDFVQKNYGIKPDDMSENHFFLYIIPKVIQLHGYGDPLLDKNMAENLKMLTENGFYSYFSCNPANIDIDRSVEMMENGLSYIKYSIESVDDDVHKEIRGSASNFDKSYEKILKLLEIKKERGFKTVFVITMLDLGRFNQEQEFKKLNKAFEARDVYIYLKSQDQQWYENKDIGTKSIHWSEICQHPWMSMTIKSNGEVAMCMEDFDNEIVLGDIKNDTLSDIWNGQKYREFREAHLEGAHGLKCSEQCDMKLLGDFL